MIRLENLTKTFILRGRRKTVANNINLDLPTGRSIALLGRNGAGKSTLLSMIAGSLEPTSGRILSTGTISYPVGFAGSFHQDLTGAQNTRFVARIYGVDTDELIDFVQDFAELGKHFHLPIRSYSSGMKGRLSFGVSMGIKFDTYLVDEATSTGDPGFREKAQRVFYDRMKDSGMVMVNHSERQIRELCDMAAILENGKLTLYDDMDAAFDRHNSNLGLSEGSARLKRAQKRRKKQL